MQFLFIVSIISVLLPFPFIAAYIAKRFGRNYWFWFALSIPLPLISCFILLCFPDKSIQEIPVENEDIYRDLNGIQ